MRVRRTNPLAYVREAAVLLWGSAAMSAAEALKIRLNDSDWSAESARAVRRLALVQLGRLCSDNVLPGRIARSNWSYCSGLPPFPPLAGPPALEVSAKPSPPGPPPSPPVPRRVRRVRRSRRRSARSAGSAAGSAGSAAGSAGPPGPPVPGPPPLPSPPGPRRLAPPGP